LDKQHGLLLCGYSPVIFPRPADWREWCQVTGYWFLDRRPDWRPPAGLVDFIESGSPPVFVGFGSMGDASTAKTRELVVEALARSGQRGVLQGGEPGSASSAWSDDIYLVNDIPHDWLFERMSLVVHQGGAGTTHAGLRAGKPCIIVPHIPDQHFWAHRMSALGVSPPALSPRGLSAERLATAVRTVTTSAVMRKRAAAIGYQIKNEDGVARAVTILNDYLERGPTRQSTFSRLHCSAGQ
jgi:sterol 3beta-glucosyltransferase